MGTPYLSEIKIMSFNFPPKGWAFCNGQLLPINQNQALFSLLGTTYGGDGRVNFGLPNLQGRVPTSMGTGMTLGELGGEQAHTLTISETPTHSHTANASSINSGGSLTPGANYLGGFSNFYNAGGTLTSMVPNTIGNNGGSQAHQNMQPYLTLSFCIALQGIFPSQN
jgi:microcystin-dependent protein